MRCECYYNNADFTTTTSEQRTTLISVYKYEYQYSNYKNEHVFSYNACKTTLCRKSLFGQTQSMLIKSEFQRIIKIFLHITLLFCLVLYISCNISAK